MAPRKHPARKGKHGRQQSPATHHGPRPHPGAAGKAPHPHGALHADMESRLPDHLRKDIEGLRKYEGKIMAGLKDEDTARLFLSDPRAA